MHCNTACVLPLSSKLMQQTEYDSSCKECQNTKKKKKSKKKSKCEKKYQPKLDCNEDFTPSGMKPEKTAGPLGSDFNCCTKYAPCGCWDTCKDDHMKQKCFQGYPSSSMKAPFGPYGPWTNNGPSQFKIVKQKFIDHIFPTTRKRAQLNGLDCRIREPMGKMRPWPLSGSCRYAGRPYGPCRPFGAYKSRGPFGFWAMAGDTSDHNERPDTPAQPCWKPAKKGYRPCTPCHRPLFRPCKNKCLPKAECNYVQMTDHQLTCVEKIYDKF